MYGRSAITNTASSVLETAPMLPCRSRSNLLKTWSKSHVARVILQSSTPMAVFSLLARVKTDNWYRNGGKKSNGHKGLGINTTKNTKLVTPTRIEFFVDRKIKIVSVALGDDHTLALDSRNQLWSWGSSREGQVTMPRGGTLKSVWTW